MEFHLILFAREVKPREGGGALWKRVEWTNDAHIDIGGKRNPCNAFGFIQFPSISKVTACTGFFQLFRQVWNVGGEKRNRCIGAHLQWAAAKHASIPDILLSIERKTDMQKKIFTPASLTTHICSRKTACCFWIGIQASERGNATNGATLSYAHSAGSCPMDGSTHTHTHTLGYSLGHGPAGTYRGHRWTAKGFRYAIGNWISIVFTARKAINFEWQRIKVSSKRHACVCVQSYKWDGEWGTNTSTSWGIKRPTPSRVVLVVQGKALRFPSFPDREGETGRGRGRGRGGREEREATQGERIT